MNLDFPYRFDDHGRTAVSDPHDHVRDLMEQVLFTTPGERVMRPDFGSGLLVMVFEPSSGALAATAQMLVMGALQQHLGHLIAVEEVVVAAEETTLRVEVRYVLLSDRSARNVTLESSGGIP